MAAVRKGKRKVVDELKSDEIYSDRKNTRIASARRAEVACSLMREPCLGLLP